MVRLTACMLLCLFMFPATSLADDLLLKSGSEFHGKVIDETDDIITFAILVNGHQIHRRFARSEISLLVRDDKTLEETSTSPTAPPAGAARPQATSTGPRHPAFAQMGITEIPEHPVHVQVMEIADFDVDPWQLEKANGLGFYLREAEHARDKVRLESPGTDEEQTELRLTCIKGWVRQLKKEINRAENASRRGMTLLRAWDGTNGRYIQVECRSVTSRRKLRAMVAGEYCRLMCTANKHAFHFDITADVYDQEKDWDPTAKEDQALIRDITKRTINQSRNAERGQKFARWEASLHDLTEDKQPRIEFGEAYDSCEIITIETCAKPAAWKNRAGDPPWISGSLKDQPKCTLETLVSPTGRGYLVLRATGDSMSSHFLVHVFARDANGKKGRRITKPSGLLVEPGLGSHMEFVPRVVPKHGYLVEIASAGSASEQPQP